MQGSDNVYVTAIEDSDALERELVRELTDFNSQVTGAFDLRDLAFAVREEQGSLAAGLTGWSWGGSAVIDLLWVRGDQRGRGLGGLLLAAAEKEAVARGCSRILVSSFTFQAPDFYKRNGYREFARTKDVPLMGYADVHLVKSLIVE